MDPTPAPPPSTNRLSHEKSPYLLQHAHNPVDWFPWGEEAFAEARREDKPIFLSIGYSTCHWCHVMAHESFEDPRTAAVMNELFINIKLDREERPDVDRVYMTFVQATAGSGGWPMSVWLQPDLKPILGGTYFPPDDRHGRRGFSSICRAVAHAWNDERDKVLAQGERIVSALRDYTRSERSPAATGSPAPSGEILRTASATLASGFDPEWGGFGQAPKFPRPVTLALLARAQARLTGNEGAHAREMLLVTLDRMAAGGIHDHLGGGFHRYSVDRYWHVPHFEKMLYDQAQLTVAYLEAFQISGEKRYAEDGTGYSPVCPARPRRSGRRILLRGGCRQPAGFRPPGARGRRVLRLDARRNRIGAHTRRKRIFSVHTTAWNLPATLRRKATPKANSLARTSSSRKPRPAIGSRPIR